MRKILKAMAAAMILVAAVGCQTQPPTKPAMASRNVLDVHPVRRPAPTYVGSPSYAAATSSFGAPSATPPEEPTAQPIVTPVASESPAPTAAAAPAKSHSRLAARGKFTAGRYQVKKGDTLYRIAKTHYGDAKKWTQIASANPGLTPQSLKVGQSIILP